VDGYSAFVEERNKFIIDLKFKFIFIEKRGKVDTENFK